jgi:hypothetical protein
LFEGEYLRIIKISPSGNIENTKKR